MTRRNERFATAPDLSNEIAFADGNWNGSRFVYEWQRRCPNLEAAEYGDILRHAIDGLCAEGMKLGYQEECHSLVQHLNQWINAPFEQIGRACVRLYTMNNFVYGLVNKTLRDHDLSKIETLGPFCFLLFQFNFAPEFRSYRFTGRVYRGANLSSSQIEEYQRAMKQVRSWSGFTSTSRQRSMAESFSQTNVLFIIDILPSASCSALAISEMSMYPQEDEVLIRAGRHFTIDRVECTYSKQTLIYLTIE